MSNTVLMKAPSGLGQVIATGPLNSGQTYTVDNNGFILVDPRDVLELIRGGFLVSPEQLNNRDNLIATTDPVPTNDGTQDYGPGSIWVNTLLNRIWMCAIGTTGVAVWRLLSQPGNNPRNMIDGGDATTNLWQLGTSFNGGSSAVLLADRFIGIGGTGSSWVASRALNTSAAQGFSAAFQFGRSSTDTHTTGLTFGQVFESADSIRAQGLPVTMSMFAQAGANFAAGASGGTLLMQLLSGTGVDDTFANMAAGSWTGAATVGTVTITPGTTAARFMNSTLFTVPTGATQLGWAMSYTPSAATTAGVNEWIQMLGIQVELGGLSDFEHLDVAEVAEICQRYLFVVKEPTASVQVGTGVSTAASLAAINIPTPITMRKAPTLTFTAGGFAITDGAGGNHTISGAGPAGGANTVNNIGMQITAAATLTAGHSALMVGRTTGSGILIADADYA